MQRQRQSAGAAGALANLAALHDAIVPQHIPIEIRPAIVVHIVHQLVVYFSKTRVQFLLLLLILVA